MAEDRVKRKLSAILSADVVGYSRLMGEDEISTVRTLEAYRKVMSDLIEQFRGRVVDSPGDNLLSEFSSVVDAVQCAVEIHEVIRAKNEELPEDRRMLFRIGVNLGDVIEEGDRIYGDGVNIAARLEGLAEAGGICISGSAHEQIENKLALGYEFLGEHTVKNITKPVKVYKVPIGPKAAISKAGDEKRGKLKNYQGIALGAVGAIIVIIGALAIQNFYLRDPSIEPASIERMEYPLPDKPSIAVLPFTNMSGDPEQEYIGDGLSENIISALSVSSEIFVIARNTTFTYKGKPVDIKQVAEDLGVQYVLEGSILKSGERLRVTAQLIDALSGYHLWSDVYDREMRELFDLLDEITKKIVVSLQVEFGERGEDFRLYAKSTDNLEAWKHYIKGSELYFKFKPEDNAKAREHFKAALELDPSFVGVLRGLALTHLHDSSQGWSDSPLESMNRAFELARKAVELDEQDPGAYSALGVILLFQRQHEKAITEGKMAITLNPNYADGHVNLAIIMLYSGRFDEAITLTKKAYRLNPNLSTTWLFPLAESYIFLRRYEEAFEICKQMEGNYEAAFYYSWLYQELGREEEARAYMAEALKIKPDYSLENSATEPYKNPAHLQRMQDALRKAGMPEKPPGAVQEKPSIAVLPFDDLSPEKDQEYFVLGLSEEILNSLAQISDLTVIAKTSSFSFKGKDKTIQEIASVLDVDHILEGSVRKAGNALRITAQLIKAVDGSHLWSKTYDRELRVKEIFAVQGDIATAVAGELKMALGIDKSLIQLGGTDNLRAYELYLVAKGQMALSWEPTMMSRVLESIERPITIDPEFALAWDLKAQGHIQLSLFGPTDLVTTEQDAALQAAQRAIELEPNLGSGYVKLGMIKMQKGDLIEAETYFRKAYKLLNESLSGDDDYMVAHYNSVGNFKRAHELIDQIQRNDPLHTGYPGHYMMNLAFLGNTHEAEEEYERCRATFGDIPWHNEIITYLRLGFGQVVSRDEIVFLDPIFDAAKEHLDSPEEGLAELRRIYSNDDNLTPLSFWNISVWAAYFDDPELAMDAIENTGQVFFVWLPVFLEVRQLPRFKEFVREIGLVDYWKEYGWPDFCRPVGDDDFVCD